MWKTAIPYSKYVEAEHDFFLSLEEALKHRDWLVGMKSRFKANKDRLKSICLDYRQPGEWLMPPKADT